MNDIHLDLHVHSRFSHDSNSTLQSLIQAARNADLDGFALTDHNTGEGWEQLKQRADDHMIIIQGMEISSTAGHILGYFLENPEPPEERDPVSVIEWIHNQNGMAVLAHPFVRNKTVPRKIAKRLDGIELENFRYSRETLKRGGMNRRQSILGISHEFDLTQTGGSDAHVPSDVGKSRTVFHESDQTKLQNALQRATCRTRGNKIGWFRHATRKITSFLTKPIFGGKQKVKKKQKKRKNHH